jgi:hypothetical protein
MGRSTKPTMTFHESFGIVTTAQLRAYKRFNVSPSDVARFGNDHVAITACVSNPEFQQGGSFSVFALWNYA